VRRQNVFFFHPPRVRRKDLFAQTFDKVHQGQALGSLIAHHIGYSP